MSTPAKLVDPPLKPGLTLAEKLADRDKLTDESGHYFGVKEFSLRDQDPMKFEMFYSRIQSAVLAAREVARYVAASPGGREMGENCWALATAEGDSLALSMGFVSHAASFPVAIRFMVDRGYETNPGFNDGDVYVCDDGLTGGAPHPGDTYTYVPIVRDGEVVAWACSVNHIMECGAPQSGSWAFFCVDTYMDGHVFPPTRTGENLQQYAWWDELWKRRTRAAAMNILDDKMRLAGCANVLHSTHEIIDEFGLDYFKQATKEVIEETRRVFVDNIRSWLVPGQYENVGFRACCYKGLQNIWKHADKDHLISVRQTIEIDDQGCLVADMEGTSRWGFHAFNCYPGGAKVALMLSMAAALGHNTKFTAGGNLACKLKLPHGSILNPDTTIAAHSNAWAQSAIVAISAFSAVNRGMYSRGYMEETFSVETVFDAIQGDGVLEDGTPYGFTNFELLGASSQGGFSYRDGQPSVWMLASQLSNMGNSEEFEYLCPAHFHLGRKLQPGYCGHGKYRGGLGQTAVHWVVEPGQRCGTSRAGNTTSITTTLALGMSGGYPGPGGITVINQGTNVDEVIANNGELPTTLQECIDFVEDGRLKVDKQTVWNVDAPEHDLKHNDIWAQAASASGGWGDPIERDPDACREDARTGQVTAEFSEVLSGVVLKDVDGQPAVDEAATQQRREAIRQERKAKSVPASEWWKNQRSKVVKQDFIDVVKDMHQSTTSFDGYHEHYFGFWALPEDFVVESA